MLERMTPSGLRVPLRWRVLLLLVLLAALNVVFTALTRSEIAQVTQLDAVGARLVQATRVEEQLQGTRDNQVLTLHAFALTGELRFLREYQDHRLTADRRNEQLSALLRDEPALREGAARVEEAMATWERDVATPVIQAPPDERADVGARLVRTTGAPLYRQVRDAVDDLVRGLDARQEETSTSVQEARARLNQQLLTMSGLSLLLIAGSVWAMRRWITAPVATLSTQAKRVAGGDLDAQIEAVGPPEFEEIGHNMERMRRRIVSELRSTTQAFEALEQRAPLVSSMRALLQTRSATDLPAGLHVSAALEPAHGVLAGDWYDVVRVDEDRTVVLVVDVSGHGEEAGLRALWLKHLLVPALRMGLEPGDALTWVARELGETTEWFATCVLIEVDVSTGACLYANAGHPPPLLLGPDGVEELDVTGPLLGPLPRQRWTTGQTALPEDRLLVVYTDGIVEARDEAGEEFGDERLVACLRSGRTRDPDVLTEHVMDCVHAFASERLDDDATLAVVSFSTSDRVAATTPEVEQVQTS
jgi:CHASE3 domain sensor protein